MVKSKLVCIDGTLGYTASEDVSQDYVDAWSHTAMFSHAVARTKSKDPSSKEYLDAFLGELAQLGWNIIESSVLSYTREAGTNQSPAQVADLMIGPYLDDAGAPGGRNKLNQILSAINTSPDTGVHDFMSFWWNGNHPVDFDQHQYTIGPLALQQGNPTVTTIFYGLNYHADGWRSMFIQRTWSKLDIKATEVRMQLDYSMYLGYKEHLYEKIKDKIDDHIDNTELDFGPGIKFAITPQLIEPLKDKKLRVKDAITRIKEMKLDL
jgi:hypothetical protein